MIIKKIELEKKIVHLVIELLSLIPYESIILSRHLDLKPSAYEDSFKRAHAIPKTNDSILIFTWIQCIIHDVRWVENFDKTHCEGCNKQMNIILGTTMGWPLVETMHGY